MNYNDLLVCFDLVFHVYSVLKLWEETYKVCKTILKVQCVFFTLCQLPSLQDVQYLLLS